MVQVPHGSEIELGMSVNEESRRVPSQPFVETTRCAAGIVEVVLYSEKGRLPGWRAGVTMNTVGSD
jgi:hypothetical protein